MSENEAAELFNRELDVLLRDGRPAFPSHDEGLMAAASSIAAADFSGDSLVREELRARLTGKRAGTGVLALVSEAVSAAAFKVVFAAACLLLLVTQVARQPHHRPAAPELMIAAVPPSYETSAPAAGERIQAGTAREASRAPLAAPPRASFRAPAAAPAPAAVQVFTAVPMSFPRGEPLESFPIVSAGGGLPIVTAEASVVKVDGGTDLVMETEGAVFIIERRVTSHEELFERRTI